MQVRNPLLNSIFSMRYESEKGGLTMRQFLLIFLIIFISLSIGLGQEQPKLRQGHAQTPEAAKEELVQFKEAYGDLAGWKLRKKRICDGILEGAKLSTLPEKKPLRPQFFDMAEHLGLDISRVYDRNGKLDESFVVVEEYKDLLVFGPDNPRPKDAVKPNSPLP